MRKPKVAFLFVLLSLILLGNLVAGASSISTVAPAPVVDDLSPQQYLPLVMRSGPTPTPTPSPGWVKIMTEKFEGGFPNAGWEVFDNNGPTYGEFYWDDDDYKPYQGTRSAWPARGGADGVDPQIYCYPDDLDSWMVYGPFSLADALDAELRFRWWIDSEQDWDWFFWGASVNGINFYGEAWSGYSAGWLYPNFDLTSVSTLGDLRGQPHVWVAFIFTSDIITFEGCDGVFVDNIVLRKLVMGAGVPGGLMEEIVSSEFPSTLSVDSEFAVSIHDEPQRSPRSPIPTPTESAE